MIAPVHERMRRHPNRRIFARTFPVLAMVIGVAILLCAAFDGKFNGADLLGWLFLVVGAMRIMRPIPGRRRA